MIHRNLDVDCRAIFNRKGFLCHAHAIRSRFRCFRNRLAGLLPERVNSHRQGQKGHSLHCHIKLQEQAAACLPVGFQQDSEGIIRFFRDHRAGKQELFFRLLQETIRGCPASIQLNRCISIQLIFSHNRKVFPVNFLFKAVYILFRKLHIQLSV